MLKSLFDTHAHYNSQRFDSDRDELLPRLPEQGVGYVLNVGYDMNTSRIAADIAERYSHAYAAVGIHPHGSEELTADALGELCALAALPKVIAVGETGLDYFRNLSPMSMQREAFRMHMELAEELGLPVIVHDRDAHDDCLAIVREFPRVKTVFHCYSGSAEMARELTAGGHFISFTANITYPASDAREPALAAGLERIMIETDCPYLPPVSRRGKRNDSTLLYTVAEALADCFGISAEKVAEITTTNAKEFFGV
jgi:TatD DNase family protein